MFKLRRKHPDHVDIITRTEVISKIVSFYVISSVLILYIVIQIINILLSLGLQRFLYNSPQS